MTLKKFLQTIKGNDFKVYNQNEDLIFSTFIDEYHGESLLPYVKHEVDLVELRIDESFTPYVKIYII